MITCVIRYTLDPHAIEDFEKSATNEASAGAVTTARSA
jgi:hypothetical protein